MPSNPKDRAVASLEQLALSDQDVELLHEIVTRAEQYPDADILPFRVIFSAYDAVLSEHGIPVESDQTYLPFLFQLGTVRNGSISERFESLLASLGIRLEYGEDAEPNESLPNGISPHAREDSVHVLQQRPNGVQPRKVEGRRRASFDSVYDATQDLSQRAINRPSSRSSMSRLESGTVRSLDFDAEIKKLYPYKSDRSPQRQRSRNSAGSDINGQASRVLDDDSNSFSSESSQHSNAQELGSGHRTDPNIVLEHQYSENGLSITSDETPDTPQVPPELFYQPSNTQRLRDASVFDMYRQRNALRLMLSSWSKTAKRKRELVQAMEQRAIYYDSKALVVQVLDLWKAALQDKREAAEAEREASQNEKFFNNLEERAARARDLYLLTKAFTHWSQIASDEVHRTETARRHLLCIKYFNAWREITAVNELKAQRFILKRPFKLWHTQHQQIASLASQADEFRQRSLKRRTYSYWFWSFCDRLAPRWNRERLKQRSFIAWLRALRTQRERDLSIDSNRTLDSLKITFQALVRKYREVSSAESSANDHWKAHTTSHYLTEWSVKQKYRTPFAEVTSRVNTKLLRSCLESWSRQTRMERSARDADRLRVMRNCWTTWNDHLRCQALSSRTEERIVLQALYKWILMGRLRLLNRIHQQRMKASYLKTLMENSRGLYNELLVKEARFRTNRKRKLAQAAFSYWKQRLDIQKQRELVSRAFYAPPVQQEVLQSWKARSDHLATLNTWAKKSEYFFLTTKTLKQWRSATAESAKRRRLEAYAAIRRKVKMNLASAIISAWRSRCATVREMHQQSTQIYGAKLIATGTNIFHLWSEKTTQRAQHLADAQLYYNRQLVYNNLTHWAGMQRSYQMLDEKATRFLEIHVSGIALAQIRKLSLRIFEVKTRLETADALYGRNTRKHYRNMIHHWREKAKISKDFDSFPIETPSKGGHSIRVDDPHEWQGIDHSHERGELPIRQPDFTSHTPISTPGYLNSPSKRAARARALVQMSTTPATPLPTSFPSKLWAASEPRLQPIYSTRRSAFKRGATSTNVRFAIDEEPESPTEGRSTGRELR
ncbi:hypothetical protein MGYG_08017 [Nannizzia gypsea CBS 118893]|uniref:Sfi1 spindle body domain-containing protein n=1 Tax=Arthroderma gypseum (strain ATCC MYA-4604 / CBS 118893) TaxID=535722 RepID=E4V4U0_ARTGP|nr:hypothetical protein MGYG_08017 [Nannizzia gypsea CBS 118893]EFR05014.1 hypothetical protein MGYG_08017 [Nannizzia gypsea CBS 118893]